MVTNLPSSYFRTYLKSYLMVSVYIAEIISRGESTLSCYPYLCNLFYSLIWSLRALNLTFIFELNNSHNLFFSSILKYNTILDIYIFPPDTSYICLTIFKHIYSISADSIGDDIESVYNNKGTKNEKKKPDSEQYSGPSNVTKRSFNGNFVFFISFIFVFLESKQNCGDQDTFIIELWLFLGSINF